MPLIWNNKEYKLVDDGSEWDKLEFIVARKLFVQYRPLQPISIDFIKQSFQIYGSLEKIEIFRDDFSNTKFAHITFKDNRTDYLALIDNKNKTNSNIQLIRPADAHEQPDNPVDSSKSHLYNLPEKCLLIISKYCDIHALATLSAVCKKMCGLLRSQFFVNKFNFEENTSNETEVTNALVTASRLLLCIDPVAFEVKIRRKVLNSIVWPTISVDFVSSKRSTLFVDAMFFRANWLNLLETVKKRIERIRIQYTIYDCLDIAPVNIVWPNVNTLIVGGCRLTNQISNFPIASTSMPKTVLIRNLCFKWNINNHYCHAESLQDVSFESCLFASQLTCEQFRMVVTERLKNLCYQPICMKFDRTQILNKFSQAYSFESYTYSAGVYDVEFKGLTEALQDEDIKKYIRFEIESDSFSD